MRIPKKNGWKPDLISDIHKNLEPPLTRKINKSFISLFEREIKRLMRGSC